MTDGRAKMLVAYHEAGHAIAATLTPGHDPVQKLSLIPRGQARGLTWFLPGRLPARPPCGLRSHVAAAVAGPRLRAPTPPLALQTRTAGR